jgi:hypothetical protein
LRWSATHRLLFAAGRGGGGHPEELVPCGAWDREVFGHLCLVARKSPRFLRDSPYWLARGIIAVVRFGRAQSCRSWANWNTGPASSARFCTHKKNLPGARPDRGGGGGCARALAVYKPLHPKNPKKLASGWDAAAEARRDAQDEFHSAAQARAWADGDFDADHGFAFDGVGRPAH